MVLKIGEGMRRPVGAILLVLIGMFVMTACERGSTLSGTSLDFEPAPNFTLTDQFGRRISLSDLRGKVVALTFLYTSCPDTCPLVTSKLASLHDEFADRAEDLAFVIVSVDPERDTVSKVRQYLEDRGSEKKLIFLTGDESDLRRVWRDYSIGVIKQPPSEGHGSFYEVSHVDVLYLIDKEGRARTLIQGDFQLEDLSRDLRLLLDE